MNGLRFGVSERTSFTVSTSTGGGARLDLDECWWNLEDREGLLVLTKHPILWEIKKDRKNDVIKVDGGGGLR